MENKIKAALATLAIISCCVTFMVACVWYPMFMLNAMCIGLICVMVVGLYKALVLHYNAKDNTKQNSKQYEAIIEEAEELLKNNSVEDAVAIVNEKIIKTFDLKSEAGYQEFDRLTKVLDYLKNK